MGLPSHGQQWALGLTQPVFTSLIPGNDFPGVMEPCLQPVVNSRAFPEAPPQAQPRVGLTLPPHTLWMDKGKSVVAVLEATESLHAWSLAHGCSAQVKQKARLQGTDTP